MKITKKSLILSLIVVSVSALAVVAVVNAATSLTPPGSPVGSMHTLENVYQNVQSGLVWATDQGFLIPWNASNCNSNCLDPRGDGTLLLGATEYCTYLNISGTALASLPVNYWHLPTLGELLQGLSEGYIESSTGNFADAGNGYFSSTPDIDNPGSAWTVAVDNGTLYYGIASMSASNLNVRCVR